jgi:3-oxoacyl-[acyl-carrier protein] reductase
MRLAGKVAIVTGGASGFGRAICETFAGEGASVMVCDINGQGARAIANAIGKNAIHAACDVSRKADVDAMVAETVSRFGGVDIMVNNAGYTHKNQPMLEVGEADFDRIYAVNVKQIYLTACAVVPVMEKRGGGVIITTASTAGVRPRPGLTWYNGSKGAAITLTKSMAAELAPKNIRV